jgi:ABC-2 type transport system ATP-binding protein
MHERMIEVHQLTKRYAKYTAVNDVSFEVGSGEIVGLLGPNGAGKSSILKILSCYMPATSGTVRVAGYDVFHNSREVRRQIGYMPENNPLHPEMRVREYLKFRARLKRLTRAQVRERVSVVLEQCGLTEVQKRIIGQLSKGYKQRVGLADALVHEPKLIILDEPTIGLDPNQLRSVRELIKGLAGKHTVLLSTHILPEVEVSCTRVLILHKGEILAADTTENLRKTVFKAGAVIAEIAAPFPELMQAWAEVETVMHVDVAPIDGEYSRCSLTPRDGVDLRPTVYEMARERGWRLRELTRGRHSLEDIFVKVTRGEPGEEI